MIQSITEKDPVIERRLLVKLLVFSVQIRSKFGFFGYFIDKQLCSNDSVFQLKKNWYSNFLLLSKLSNISSNIKEKCKKDFLFQF